MSFACCLSLIRRTLVRGREAGMFLEGQNAVVYGAGGALGAVSRAFAREGAAVSLTGRRMAPLDAAATEIRAVGGAAETAAMPPPAPTTSSIPTIGTSAGSTR